MSGVIMALRGNLMQFGIDHWTKSFWDNHPHLDVHEECPFCPQIKSKSPFVIESGEHVSLLLSLEGHPLIVSTEHYTPLTIPDSVSAQMGIWSFNRLASVMDFYQAQGMNLITNISEAAGQEVEHVHTHLLPRFISEGKRFPKLVRREDSERLTIARSLRAHLTQS